jgi:hypothetical protein
VLRPEMSQYQRNFFITVSGHGHDEDALQAAEIIEEDMKSFTPKSRLASTALPYALAQGFTHYASVRGGPWTRLGSGKRGAPSDNQNAAKRHVPHDPMEELATALQNSVSCSSAVSSVEQLSKEEEQRIIDQCLELLEGCDPEDATYSVAVDEFEECEGAGMDADVDMDGSLEHEALGDCLVPYGAGAEVDFPAYVSDDELLRNSIVRPRGKRKWHLNFWRPQFLYYVGRLHGHVRRWAVDVFKKLGYASTRLPLFLSYVYFLGECLTRQTGVFAVSPVVKTWWQSGSNRLTDAEESYMHCCQPAMDSRQRTRVPKLLDLLERLQKNAGVTEKSSAGFHRLITAWLCLVMVAYYIGRPEFITEVLFDIHPLERCNVEEVIVRWVKGGLEQEHYGFVPYMTAFLKYYVLTRSAAKVWFNFLDGMRLCDNDAPVLASDSRMWDSLVHVLPAWFLCAGEAATKLLALHVSMSQSKGDIDQATRELMLSLLKFPLMGRPRRPHADLFLDSVHCYWSKFPFNVCTAWLFKVGPNVADPAMHVALHYSFIGPAPRFMHAELMGNVKSSMYKDMVLHLLQELQQHVKMQFRVDHWLYSLQVNPCDFCHFAGALHQIKHKEIHDFSFHARGTGMSAIRQQLLTTLKLENSQIRINLFLLAPLEDGMRHFADKWEQLTVSQRVWLCRCIDPSQQQDLKKLKKIIAGVKNDQLVWLRSATGARLARLRGV